MERQPMRGIMLSEWIHEFAQTFIWLFSEIPVHFVYPPSNSDTLPPYHFYRHSHGLDRNLIDVDKVVR